MSCSNCGTSTCGGCHSCGSCGSSACTGTCGCNCGGIPAGCNPAVCPQSTPCGTVLPASPLPYYVQSPQCQEDHCQQIIKNWYSAAICTNYAFNIPACGGTAIVYFSDLKKLVVNSYLWHPTYGYLKVVGFDFQTGQVTVLNECQDGNAAAGTNVPACTCFIAAPAPIDTAFIGASCVAVDFTAPAVGACLDITVTNVNNLQVPGLVAIGSGVYTLAAIVSASIINICNDGLGITPGTPVIALDANGDYQYCLSMVGTNPCSEDPVADGDVLVCKDGGLATLTPGTVGQVLTALSGSTSGFADLGQLMIRFNEVAADHTESLINGATATSNVASITLTNTTNKTMELFGTIECYLQATASLVGGTATMGIGMESQVNGGGYSLFKAFLDGFYIDTSVAAGRNYCTSLGATLAPGQIHDLDVRFKVTNFGATALNIGSMYPIIAAVALAIAD